MSKSARIRELEAEVRVLGRRLQTHRDEMIGLLIKLTEVEDECKTYREKYGLVATPGKTAVRSDES